MVAFHPNPANRVTSISFRGVPSGLSRVEDQLALEPHHFTHELRFPERGVVRVEACPVPAPGAGEVLIRTRVTLVSTGTELTVLTAAYLPGSAWEAMFPFPVRPGYDNVGEVVALGEAVVVFGAGLLGQLTARVCLLAGAAAVVVVDVAPARLALLPEDPRLHPVDPHIGDVADLVREVTRGRLADVAFEVTGEPGLLAQQIGVLREQGRLVILSSPRGRSTIDLHDHCVLPSVTIVGAHNSSHPQVATLADPWVPARHAELFFDLVRHGLLDVDRLISDRVPYREAPALYERLMRDRSGVMGAVFRW